MHAIASHALYVAAPQKPKQRLVAEKVAAATVFAIQFHTAVEVSIFGAEHSATPQIRRWQLWQETKHTLNTLGVFHNYFSCSFVSLGLKSCLIFRTYESCSLSVHKV